MAVVVAAVDGHTLTRPFLTKAPSITSYSTAIDNAPIFETLFGDFLLLFRRRLGLDLLYFGDGVMRDVGGFGDFFNRVDRLNSLFRFLKRLFIHAAPKRLPCVDKIPFRPRRDNRLK